MKEQLKYVNKSSQILLNCIDHLLNQQIPSHFRKCLVIIKSIYQKFVVPFVPETINFFYYLVEVCSIIQKYFILQESWNYYLSNLPINTLHSQLFIAFRII